MTKKTNENIEIERKFLVKNNDWKKNSLSTHKIIQGYICTKPEKCVRVRILDNFAYLTIKGKGIKHHEFEYSIPLEDAKSLIENFCKNCTVQKTRHIVKELGKTWEIDVFENIHKGLIIAEVELNEVNEKIEHPHWLGCEVTGKRGYYNSNLATKNSSYSSIDTD